MQCNGISTYIGMKIDCSQIFEISNVELIISIVVIIIFFLAEIIGQIFFVSNTIIVSISINLIIITIILLFIPIIIIKVIKTICFIDFVFFMILNFLILNCLYKKLYIHPFKQKFTKMLFTLTVTRV